MGFFSELFGNKDITPEQELVLWVEKWKRHQMPEKELAAILRGMASQLDHTQRSAR